MNMLSSDSQAVLVRDKIDTTDDVYIAWTKDESISLKEYLNHAISMNWIDTSKLDLNDKYSSSEEMIRASSLTSEIPFAPSEQIRNASSLSRNRQAPRVRLTSVPSHASLKCLNMK